MFVIKAVEYLTHGVHMSGLDASLMNMFRRKLTIDLYRHGAVKLATGYGSDDEFPTSLD